MVKWRISALSKENSHDSPTAHCFPQEQSTQKGQSFQFFKEIKKKKTDIQTFGESWFLKIDNSVLKHLEIFLSVFVSVIPMTPRTVFQNHLRS